MLHILTHQQLTTRFQRCPYDQRIPKRSLLSFVQRDRGEDHRRVHLNHAIRGKSTGRFRGVLRGKRFGQFSRDRNVEFLQHLGAHDNGRFFGPDSLEEIPCGVLFLLRVGIKQVGNVGIDENTTAHAARPGSLAVLRVRSWTFATA